MKDSLNEVQIRYNRFSRIPFIWDLDAFLSRATERSIYREKAISLLDLNHNSVVLDAACGNGLSFKLIQSYLDSQGKIIGIDISSTTLKLAKERVNKYHWKNIELVCEDISRYDTDIEFDAVLCALAINIIPDFQNALSIFHKLLKPGGKFAAICLQYTKITPWKLFKPYAKLIFKNAGAEPDRDIISIVRSLFGKIDHYEEGYHGFYYIISATKQ